MSPRAAARLRSIGYTEVYDYVGGKADWLASGGTLDGTGSTPETVGGHVDRAVPSVELSTDIAVVRELLAVNPLVMVTTEEDVVLGRIGLSDLPVHESMAAVEDVMQGGPTTVRANEPLDELHRRMEHRGVTELVVTRPDGVLIGVHRWSR